MAIPLLNDGSNATPALKTFLKTQSLLDLPPTTELPGGDGANPYTVAAAAGFDGVQGGEPARAHEFGLLSAGSVRANTPEEIAGAARRLQDEGHVCATLHAGWGFEDDATTDSLAEAILAATRDTGFPLYLETHRATITQDSWRTVQLVRRFPDLRFTGDFSHWYTGEEMPYGDLETKVDFIQPVLERVGLLHGRIGDSSNMQRKLYGRLGGPAVQHFRGIWVRCFEAFLRCARAGDYLAFTPELLPASMNYAVAVQDASGARREESDRWEETLLLKLMAESAFNQARQNLPG